ncbi:hypothetical protein F5Y03DRAFT_392617 [Xylaria venustula]|nr:hypothetical protein F5Y03DRAFT_392617 [Xylaria venustula]
MHFLTIIPILLLPLLGFAKPIRTKASVSVAPASSDEKWTVSQVFRQRFNNAKVCNWKLVIDQSATLPSSTNGTAIASIGTTAEPIQCDFDVEVPEGHDCRIDSFGPARCSQSNDDFYVNAGHNGQEDFVVMVVENVAQNKQAYFAFRDDALDANRDIPPQTSAVVSSQGEDEDSLLGRRDDDDPALVWSIHNLARRINPDTHSVYMNFAIHGANADGSHSDPDAEPVSCTLHVPAPGDVDLAKWQFYDQKCGESDFYVSWEYLESSDAGIMTLVSPACDSEAFYGFPDISKSELLTPSVGGGIIMPCDCGGPSH